MKRYLRKVTKKSNRKFEHWISVPAKFVRELELSESIVELKITDGCFTVKKIGDTLESGNSVKDIDDDEYVTIHY